MRNRASVDLLVAGLYPGTHPTDVLREVERGPTISLIASPHEPLGDLDLSPSLHQGHPAVVRTPRRRCQPRRETAGTQGPRESLLQCRHGAPSAGCKGNYSLVPD